MISGILDFALKGLESFQNSTSIIWRLCDKIKKTTVLMHFVQQYFYGNKTKTIKL